ncbi:MAG: hypothetical protein ACLSTY_18145 [Blautia wexlerae]
MQIAGMIFQTRSRVS